MRAHQRVQSIRLATGVAVRYVRRGDPSGHPVVLLHPWAESMGCFDRLLAILPETVNAVSLDQRGHGEADKPAHGYTLMEMAADIVAFMDAIGLATAVLLGSSSGGYVAQQAAVTHPERVSGLVLVGSPRSLRGRPSFADDVDRLTDPVAPEWVQRSLEWFPRFHEVPAWYVEDRIDDGLQVPAQVWRAALLGLTTARPPTEAGRITAPTLVICGDRDELLPLSEQEALRAVIPGARLITYEETGHLVLWEQPQRVATNLNDFLESLSDRSRPSE